MKRARNWCPPRWPLWSLACALAVLLVQAVGCGPDSATKIRTCSRGLQPAFEEASQFGIRVDCRGGSSATASYRQLSLASTECRNGSTNCSQEAVRARLAREEGDDFFYNAYAEVGCDSASPEAPFYHVELDCDNDNGCITCEGRADYKMTAPCASETTGEELCQLTIFEL